MEITSHPNQRPGGDRETRTELAETGVSESRYCSGPHERVQLTAYGDRDYYVSLTAHEICEAFMLLPSEVIAHHFTEYGFPKTLAKVPDVVRAMVAGAISPKK